MPTRTLLALILPALLLALGPAPVAHAQPPSTYERQVVKATNKVRVSHALNPLKGSACLSDYAERHARLMSRQGSLSHQDLGEVSQACGLRRVAENVAAGFSNGRTVVRSAWMHSSSHRGNILTSAHRVTSVGAVRDAAGRWWTVQLLGR